MENKDLDETDHRDRVGAQFSEVGPIVRMQRTSWRSQWLCHRPFALTIPSPALPFPWLPRHCYHHWTSWNACCMSCTVLGAGVYEGCFQVVGAHEVHLHRCKQTSGKEFYEKVTLNGCELSWTLFWKASLMPVTNASFHVSHSFLPHTLPTWNYLFICCLSLHLEANLVSDPSLI